MASLGNAYRISLVVKVSDTRCEWADRSVWHDRHVGIVEVAGSNPAPSTRSVLGLSGDPEARASDYVFLQMSCLPRFNILFLFPFGFVNFFLSLSDMTNYLLVASYFQAFSGRCVWLQRCRRFLAFFMHRKKK